MRFKVGVFVIYQVWIEMLKKVLFWALNRVLKLRFGMKNRKTKAYYVFRHIMFLDIYMCFLLRHVMCFYGGIQCYQKIIKVV